MAHQWYMHRLIPTSKTCVEHLFASYLYVHASYSSPNWFCTCNLWLPSDQAPGSAISNMPVPEFKSDLRLNFNEWRNQHEGWDPSRVPILKTNKVKHPKTLGSADAIWFRGPTALSSRCQGCHRGLLGSEPLSLVWFEEVEVDSQPKRFENDSWLLRKRVGIFGFVLLCP